MNWKNQLTKTPFLVLFILLISVGVGTASALITITLAGDVHVTGDIVLDGELSVGTDNPSDDDFIRFDSGNENIQWDESQTRFRLSDSIVTGGHFAAGSISADDTVNRFGDGTPQSPDDMTAPGDLYLADDLEVTDNLYVGGELNLDGGINCSNCIPDTLSLYTLTAVSSSTIISIQCDVGDLAVGGGGGVASSDGGMSSSFPLDKDGVAASDGKDAQGWRVSAEGVSVNVISVYVICLDFNPLHITP